MTAIVLPKCWLASDKKRKIVLDCSTYRFNCEPKPSREPLKHTNNFIKFAPAV